MGNYHPLDSSLDIIRLLKISPGIGDDPVKCDLLAEDLDHDPIYETLSYTWGEDTSCIDLVIGDVAVKIRRNLADALYHLRLPGTSRILWVDAVCINQDNKEEKARQVGMMKRIYSQSSQCLMWLGGSSFTGDLTTDLSVGEVAAAFDLIRFVANVHEHDEKSVGRRLPASLRTPSRRAGACRAMMRIMASGNPWWHRIWTVQEVVLPTLKVLVWQTVSIPWEVCLSAARILVEESNDILEEILDPEVTSVLYNNVNFITPVISLAFTEAEALQRPLLTIHRWRVRNATDPRDKLYGLMGLFEAGCLPRITCGYDLSPAEVFTKLTLDLIRLEGNLLPLCGMRGEKHATPDLPTWALDLVRPEPLINSGCIFWEQSDRFRVFNADNRRARFALESSPDESLLIVRGIRIDKLQIVDEGIAVDERVSLPTSAYVDLLQRRRQILDQFVADKEMPTYPNGGSLEEAYWRTMLGDVILLDERVDRRAIASDSSLFHRFITSHERNEATETIRSMAVNQDFFVTRNGYIGIGPPGLMAGDEAWIVYGSNVPLFLRAQDSGPGRTYLGDGFVQGVMDGELARDVPGEWTEISIH